MTDTKGLIDRFWDLFERNRLDELSELIHADCDFKMPGMSFRGKDALLALLRGYREAFPDLRHTVRDHVVSDQGIALELLVEGTHQGPMVTPQGVIPPTGKKVVWDSCDFIRVSAGKVAAWHVYHDPLPFLTALGLAPPPAAQA
jgi:predicted ester cyclase